MNRLTTLMLISIACLLFCSKINCSTQTNVASTAVTTIPKDKSINNLNLEDDNRKDMMKDRYENSRRYSSKYAKHDEKDSSSSVDGHDGEDKPLKSTATSNTIVTTIIIVSTETSTETPTNIYAGNGGNPAAQIGAGGNDDNQVGDPNSTNNGGNSSSNNGASAAASETQIVEQLHEDQSAYHKVVLALSIVGGLAGIALITGGFIFARMRVKKRRNKKADLEVAAECTEINDFDNHSDGGSSPVSLPPPVHHETYARMSEDGNSTVIDFNQNPFSDPAYVDSKYHILHHETTTVIAPNLPQHLELQPSASYRQNHTLSMISQTTSMGLPSAPTAKDLDAMNPFEEKEENEMQSEAARQPIIAGTSANDLLPPPAYTPSAAPSAPPLYVLPATATQPGEDLSPTSRRHSINSIGSISRPVSLRRGSGTVISSPFS